MNCGLVLLLGTITTAHGTAFGAVTTWAGVIDFPPHALNQTLNVTVADAGAFSTATFQWTWDETSAGGICTATAETLVWTVDASNGTVFANGSACGSVGSFYSFKGH
jgi:hypothetical protein